LGMMRRRTVAACSLTCYGMRSLAGESRASAELWWRRT
jgi:hypothetical protein